MPKAKKLEEMMYHYRAVVRSVYDGDTCTIDIDLGLGTWVRGEKIRLHRIDTPELRGDQREAGLKSRDALIAKIDNKDIIIETIKDRRGKYGRYLGEIWLQDDSGEWVNINDQLVAEGWGVYREY